MTKLNIAIAGAGSAGTRLGELLLTECGVEPWQLVFVRRGKVHNPYGDKRLTEALKGVCSTSDTDQAFKRAQAVIVTNPTHLHTQTAQCAVRAGCHVLIEKPLGSIYDKDEPSRVSALQEEAHKRGLVVIVGYNLRFHEQAGLMRQWLPLVGSVRHAESETVDDVRTWHPWEDYKTSYAVCRALGGGVIATQSHEVDLWYWLFGKPNMLTTRISVNKEFAPDVEVQARTKLLYPSFHIDHFVSYFGESKRTMRVEGSCGTLVWDLKAGVLEYKGDYQAPSQKHTASSEGTRSTSFVAELKHFLACIQGAAKPQNALPEAAEVFGILKSMYLSGQRSGVPIHIW